MHAMEEASTTGRIDDEELEDILPDARPQDIFQLLRETRLAEVKKKVEAQEQSPWLITPQEAAVLLMYQQSIDWVRPRPTANKLLPGVRDTFFVEAGSPALGKRKKGEAGSSRSTAAEEAMEVTADYGSASGGSLTDLEDGSHLGVLRISGSNQAKLRLKFGKYCLVLLPGHPDYKNGSSETKEAGRNKLPFQHLVPQKWLVHATPEGEPEGTAVEQQPHTFPGDVSIAGSATVGKDLTVGPDGSGTVRAKLEGREADHAEFMPVFDEAEELNGGDVVALVGDTDGVQKVSRSARGSDRAEWRVVSTNPQMLGNKIYDEGAAVPIVLSGQVPIRVTGEPPVDAFLVPSGREDGCARVLSDEERPQNVLGQVVESRVKRGRVKALVQKGMAEGPQGRYFQRQVALLKAEHEHVAKALSAAPVPAAPAAAAPPATSAPVPDSPTSAPESTRSAGRRDQIEEQQSRRESATPGSSSCAEDLATSRSQFCPPAKGEWPWDEIGKLGPDNRSVVTPADAALNRLHLVFKVLKWRCGKIGLGVRRELADCLSGCSASANATILATGERICANGHGDTPAEALASAKWRLLEASNCQLLELLAKCESDARSSSGSDDQSETARVIRNAESKDSATSSKSRLNELAQRLLAGRMGTLQGETLVQYKPSTPLGGSGDMVGEHTGFCSSGALPNCEGCPSFTGAVARTIKASEHSAAERALAFVDRVVNSLTDPSYTFGFAKLSELLGDLRTATQQAQEVSVAHDVSHELSGLSISALSRELVSDVSHELRESLASGKGDPLELHEQLSAAHKASMRSSFKELWHVIAMRLKRPPAIEADVDDQRNWREPMRFLRYETVPADDGEQLGRSEHGTPLERAAVSFIQFDGEPTFVGAPAAGRKAAEQAAAEAALAFVFDRALAAPAAPAAPAASAAPSE